MKTKILMLLMALGMFLIVPSITYGQYTEEDMEYQGGDPDDDWGPVSLDPIIITGVLSHVNKTITNTFHADLGVVTIWIVDEQGNLCISKEVTVNKNDSVTIDLKSLPAKKYKIICFTTEGKQTAKFELKR